MPPSKGGKSAIDVAIEAARDAGDIIRSHFYAEKSVTFKAGRSNVVTDVDLLAEGRIKELLQGQYPGFGMMAEESADVRGDLPFTWIVDPIDGTRNYALGIPHFCVAIALARGDEVILGVIYDPMRDELFTAEKGGGACLNGSPIRVSAKTSLSESLVGFDLGYDAEIGQRMLSMTNSLWPGVTSVRIMGSAALGLAYVACGRLDLYFHFFLYPWDLCAGVVLVEEAGGVITEIEGQPIDIHSRTVLASNREVHRDFTDRVMR